MNPPAQSPADRGARRAREYLQLLEDGRTDAAEELLASLSDPRELVFLGAGLTVPARRIGRTLPTAMRAQSSTRQVLLGQLRDANRWDVEGLRTWLRKAAEELQMVAHLAEPDPAARRRLLELPQPAEGDRRGSVTASGRASTSRPATST